jgi:phage-related protein
VAQQKPIVFQGTSLEDLRTFPLPARREAGYQLDQVQKGQDPDDWKPMNSVGQGVREIRIRDATGAFRVISQKTRKADLDLAGQRYRDLLKETKS